MTVRTDGTISGRPADPRAEAYRFRLKADRGEISRQTQKADAAQHVKEQALQTREALEEKLKNVNAALTSGAPATSAVSFAEGLHKTGGPIKEEGLRYSVGAALRILNS